MTVRKGKKPHGNEPKLAFFPDCELRVYSAMVFRHFLTIVKMIFSSVEEKTTHGSKPEFGVFF